MKPSKLITLLGAFVILASVPVHAGNLPGAGGAKSGMKGGASGLKSGMTRPEKITAPSNDGSAKAGLEGIKNTLPEKSAAANGKLSGLKEKPEVSKEKGAAVSAEKRAEYAAKSKELRSKFSEKKTGEQKANFEKLATDVNSIKAGSSVTPEMKQTLADDLKSTLSTADKPSEESVEKFAADLSTAIADQKIGAKEAVQLSQDADAILNSADISEEDAEALKNDALEIIDAAAISAEEKEVLKTDLENIASVSRDNAAAAKEAASSGDASAAKESVKADVQEVKQEIKDIKERKNAVRERIKNIRKNK